MLDGCAAKAQPTLTDRFVRQGEAAADFGGLPPRTRRARTTTPAADLRIAEVSRYYPSDADFDRHDPRLRTALEAVALSPTLPHYLSAAQAYQEIGVLDKAYDYLQDAIAIDAHNAAANDSLARLWRDWRLPAFGLPHAHRAVYAAPRSATTRHTLGTVLHALGLRQEAEKAFREAAALDPRAWYTWQNLCTLAMADGRTKDAIPLCQRADAERATALKQARP
jgi:tetratricopeptide (TPR) repeat protein